MGLACFSACGPTPASTRSIEEKYLDMGHANRMYHYGEALAAEGQLEEALAAFQQAEDMAFTSALRKAARERRMYLEKVIAAYKKGEEPPPPPVRMPRPVIQPAPRDLAVGPQGPVHSIFDLPPKTSGTTYPPVIFPGEPGGPPEGSPPAKPLNP